MHSSSFDHIAVAVDSIEASRPLFELLTGASGSNAEELPEQGVNVLFVGPIELIEPRDPDTTVGRFLQRRGPGLHHVALRVPDLEAALDSYVARGIAAVDPGIRPGARGHRVAFLHPEDTEGVLIELVEAPPTAG